MSARNTIGAHREKYARIERERRFLVAEFPSGGRPVRVTEIVDRYFPGTTLRLRRMTARVGEGATEIFKLTQKVRSESGGPERGLITNTHLSETEYELLARLPGDDLRKTRFSIPPMGVDVFAPPLDGLNLAEAEFATDEEMMEFRPPSYALTEVTNDPRFNGGELTRATRGEIASWLADYGVRLEDRGRRPGS